jgi:hypothetical protein
MMLRINGKDVSANIDVVKNYITEQFNGLSWQDIVIDFIDSTTGYPDSPSQGDRYIPIENMDEWLKFSIYSWDDKKLQWNVILPEHGYAVFIRERNEFFVYMDETIGWIPISTLLYHDELLGINENGIYMHLPEGGTAGQVLVNTAPGTGEWVDLVLSDIDVDGGVW